MKTYNNNKEFLTASSEISLSELTAIGELQGLAEEIELLEDLFEELVKREKELSGDKKSEQHPITARAPYETPQKPQAEGTQPVVTGNTLIDDMAIWLTSASPVERRDATSSMRYLTEEVKAAIRKRVKELEVKINSDKQEDSRLQESENHTMDGNIFEAHKEKILQVMGAPKLASIFLKKYENNLTQEQKESLKGGFDIKEPQKTLEELTTDFIEKFGQHLNAQNKKYVEELLDTKIETREIPSTTTTLTVSNQPSTDIESSESEEDAPNLNELLQNYIKTKRNEDFLQVKGRVMALTITNVNELVKAIKTCKLSSKEDFSLMAKAIRKSLEEADVGNAFSPENKQTINQISTALNLVDFLVNEEMGKFTGLVNLISSGSGFRETLRMAKTFGGNVEKQLSGEKLIIHGSLERALKVAKKVKGEGLRSSQESLTKDIHKADKKDAKISGGTTTTTTSSKGKVEKKPKEKMETGKESDTRDSFNNASDNGEPPVNRRPVTPSMLYEGPIPEKPQERPYEIELIDGTHHKKASSSGTSKNREKLRKTSGKSNYERHALIAGKVESFVHKMVYEGYKEEDLKEFLKENEKDLRPSQKSWIEATHKASTEAAKTSDRTTATTTSDEGEVGGKKTKLRENTKEKTKTGGSFNNAEEPKAEGTQPVVTGNTLIDDLAIRLASESQTERTNALSIIPSLPKKTSDAINERAKELRVKMIEISSSDKQGDSKLQEPEKHAMDKDTFDAHRAKILGVKGAPTLANIFLKKYENNLTQGQKQSLKETFNMEEPRETLEELTTNFIEKFGQHLNARNKEYVEKLLGRNIETTGKEKQPLPTAVQTTSTPQRHGSSDEHSL